MAGPNEQLSAREKDMSKKTVPNVTGSTVSDAATAITNAGLTPCLGGGDSCTPITVSNGGETVASQRPSANSEADADADVNIYVNPGK